MNILLGLSGKPRSGKDTVADYLCSRYDFKRYSFADYLKYLCASHFGIPKEELWGNKTEYSRKILQSTGALLSEVCPNLFINTVTNKIREDYYDASFNSRPFRAVITDVRRQEETLIFNKSNTTFLVTDTICDTGITIKNMFNKGLLILIERDMNLLEDKEPGLDEACKHPIESLPDLFDKWNYYIYNNSGLDYLHRSIDSMMDYLLEE